MAIVDKIRDEKLRYNINRLKNKSKKLKMKVKSKEKQLKSTENN